MQSDKQSGSAYAGSTARYYSGARLICVSAIATITIDSHEFIVHADIFCEHSDYFKSCLRGNFAEAQTQSVEIEDISAEDFGLWVNAVYWYHFTTQRFVLDLSFIQILTVWKLSDRFIHKPLIDHSQKRLEHRLSLYTIEWWRDYYINHTVLESQRYIDDLQGGYCYCRAHTLPDAFSDGFVTACAKCPAQLYATYASLLDTEFMRLVSVRVVMRHADASLIPLQES
ncbi:hypothetical protein SEUCBS140593_008759 [Sporothrix eucalyptigena]|uniref:BTB domain-containing protein n=1 Tax=Sporothrix eucalyptigena TaxID=1812306 RepID=A0ABP0CQS0_9PEZI